MDFLRGFISHNILAMDAVRLSKRLLIFAVAGALYLLYAPNLLDIDPEDYQTCYVERVGALSFNRDLEKSQLIAVGDVPQPESLVYRDGKIYCALGDGRIVIVENDKVVGTLINVTDVTKKQSRPLGMKFYKDDLYFADAFLGLLKLNMKTGALTTLLSTTGPVFGKKMMLPDDIDIDDQGVIYMSEFTTKWSLHKVMYDVVERRKNGRVLTFDTKTGKVGLLLDNLHEANGLQLTKDRKALLITLTTGRKVIKYHLEGPRKGAIDPFCHVPGEPDNMRPSSRGGYWLCMPFSSSASHPHSLDSWAAHPKVRKIITRLTHMTATALSFVSIFVPLPILHYWEQQLASGMVFLNLLNLEQATVIELDNEGNILRSLQSNDPKFSLLTQALEIEGYLYLGSFVHNYIVKVKL